LVNLNNFIVDFAIGDFTSNFLLNFQQKSAITSPYFITITINYKLVLNINFLKLAIFVAINIEL